MIRIFLVLFILTAINSRAAAAGDEPGSAEKLLKAFESKYAYEILLLVKGLPAAEAQHGDPEQVRELQKQLRGNFENGAFASVAIADAKGTWGLRVKNSSLTLIGSQPKEIVNGDPADLVGRAFLFRMKDIQSPRQFLCYSLYLPGRTETCVVELRVEIFASEPDAAK